VIAIGNAPRITAADLAHNALSQRAMTVSLHLSAWSAQRLDRETTDEVLTAKKAAKDAGKWQKKLIPEGALEGVTRAHSAAGARHRALTLPWGEKVRILAAPAWFDYSQAMAEERTKCERAHSEFCAQYPDLVSSAPERLGSMYRETDFPAPAVIARRFGFRLVVLPVPHQDDFRVNLGAEIEASIRQEIEDTVTTRVQDAQRDLWTRLLTTVRHFATTMAEEKKTFQKTTVTNLTEIATIAPKLSLTPDPVLDAICADILAITDQCDAEALRVSPKIRSRAATEAKAAMERIAHQLQGAV
jgi:hypothetical protein